MIQLHFQANYLPEHKKFRVELTYPGNRLVQLMTVSHFIRFARETDKPMVIGGITVKVDEDSKEAFQAVRQYFGEVAYAYMEHKGYFKGGKEKKN